MIAIIDYDAGNIKSVEKALNYLGEEAIITRDHDEIVNSDKVILPGVGAFADAMEKIHRQWYQKETIHEVVEKNILFLGICLGLQLMFESSDEGPGVKGLGLLPGKILRIPKSGDLKIPHMGWNNIKVKEDSRLFKGLPENPYVYFVHSYYLQADDEDIVAATTEYGVKIHAAVEKDNIFACQFHPEKSSTVGLQILKNFVSLQEELAMHTKRIIPCLDVKAGRVVKGVNFVNLIDAGDPVEIAAAYDKDRRQMNLYSQTSQHHPMQEIIMIDMVRKVRRKGNLFPFTSRWRNPYG